jgi:flagellar hook-associated protein 1 FlgK
MSGLFQQLGVGARSLLASQLAQATVGNNAANVSTPGFSRRRTNLVEAPPVKTTQVLGMGVLVDGVQRLRDGFADAQFRLTSADLEFAKAQAHVLEQLGALLSPADEAAVTTALDGLWAAFGDVAARPEDVAARTALLGQAQVVVDSFHLMRAKLDTLKQDASAALEDRVTEVNEVAGRLAALNGDIKTNPLDPSLQDERDRLVDRLAALIGVRATVFDDESVQVVVQGTGIQLVDGKRAATLGATGDPLAGSIVLDVEGTVLPGAGGEIGGLLRVRNSTTDGLPFAVSAINTLAAGVIDAVNRVHASGAGLTLAASHTGSVTVADPTVTLATAGLPFAIASGTLSLGVFDATGAMVSTSSVAVNPATMSLNALAAAIDALAGVTATVSGGKLVVSATAAGTTIALGADTSGALSALGVNGFFTGSDAWTIGVSSALLADPRLVAAAQADFTTGLVSPGDNRNARALSALGEARFLSGSTETAASFLGSLGATIGTAGRAANGRVDTLSSVLEAAESQRQAVSGVNLDEEMADMVRFQHSYEASAKYIQTVDEMISALLGII